MCILLDQLYLLTSSTSAPKGFSHPYIFITRIPEMTSLIVRILSSVKTAVSALREKLKLWNQCNTTRGGKTAHVWHV